MARGMIDAKGSYTKKGEERNSMTAEERAKDRASKRTGKPVTAFGYNPKTNMALRKK
jgi:hypothetical protein